MKYLFVIFNCICVTAMAYFGVELFYKQVMPVSGSLPADLVMGPQPDNSRKGDKPASASPSRIGEIAERNLFRVELEKKDNHETAPVDPNPEQLEPTHLKLVLWGTVTGGDEKYAVIEDKKARQQSLYLKGDTVQGATLKKIFRHKVVLNYQGKDQVLEMETDTAKAGNTSRSQVNTPLVPVTKLPLKQLDLAQLAGNAGDIMRQIKFRPHYSEGEPDGLMVYGIRPNSVFRKVGLRNGDIIQQVNGTAITSQEDAMGVLDELMLAEQAKVTLLRRGKVKEIVYQANGEAESE